MKFKTWKPQQRNLRFTFLGLLLVSLFQNCSEMNSLTSPGLSAGLTTNLDASTADNTGTNGQSPGMNIITSPGRQVPQFTSLADLHLWREQIWAGKCGPSFEWEVCFEGANIPGYDQPAPFDWDNPRDDDWNRPRVTCAFMDHKFKGYLRN